MKSLTVSVLCVGMVLLAGCDQPAAPVAGASMNPAEPTAALPHLQTMKLWIGPEELTVELALNAEQQRTGMMFRTNLPENSGMLFPLPVTQRASFWMKNCLVPLSAAYIDPDGTIREIHQLAPQNTNPVVATSDNIRFVLETTNGWFGRHNVRTNMVVRTERGPLMETFFSRQ